jgi:hypothetical protein
VGPTHAVCATTGATVCGINAERLQVLNEDWEAACFVEKCPGCFTAVVARGSGWLRSVIVGRPLWGGGEPLPSNGWCSSAGGDCVR